MPPDFESEGGAFTGMDSTRSTDRSTGLTTSGGQRSAMGDSTLIGEAANRLLPAAPTAAALAGATRGRPWWSTAHLTNN